LNKRTKKIFKNFTFYFVIFLQILVLFFLLWCSGCKIASDQGSTSSAEVSDFSDSDNDANNNSTDKEIDISSSEQILDKEIITAGCDATYPPFEFLQDGQIVGFDIDIINEIAKRLDKQVEIVSISWDSDFKILREGELDLIISAVPLNKEKESLVDFSIPYFKMNYLMISPVGSEIKMKESLAGKEIGILELSEKCLSEDYLKKFKIVSYKNIMELLTALKDTKVDAVLLAIPIAVNILKENKDIYTVLEEVQSNKEFSIVFVKGSPLKSMFDDVIEEINADGIYKEIYDKWFNYRF